MDPRISTQIQPQGDAWLWLKMSMALLMVLGLMLVAAWLFRNLSRRLPGLGNRGGEQLIRIRSVRSLGDRKALAVVQVGRRCTLVGLSVQGVNALDHWEEEEVLAGPEGGMEEQKGDFSVFLRRFLSGGRS